MECPTEAFRIRKCILYYYVSDYTMHISEPKEENSGIPQGTFLKRQVVKKPHSDTPFTPQDLMIGNEVDIFGRIYKIVNVDNQTREFLESEGHLVPAGIPYPEVPVVNVAPVSSEPVQSFSHHSKPDTLKRFLEFDRKVLRFDAEWDDTKTLYGGRRTFTIHFYLADDTVEVKETHEPNSGRDKFPKLLARMKLPRHNKAGNVTAEDLTLGKTLNVFGRDLLLIGCDDFTSRFYKETYGTDQIPVDRSNSGAKKYIREIPPYTGYGDDEDSLASLNSLILKPPKRDLGKLEKLSKVVLRFEARYEHPSNDEKDRRFIIAFYAADDSLTIFSPNQRNSGIIAGKFLERGVYKNPFPTEGGAPRKFKESDFQVGKSITVSFLPRSSATTKSFLILDEDAFTKSYRRSLGIMSPRSRLESIIERVAIVFEYSSIKPSELFSAHDYEKLRFVSHADFTAILRKLGLTEESFSNDDLSDFIRHLDPLNENKIRYDALFDELSVVASSKINKDKAAVSNAYKLLLEAFTASKINVRNVFRGVDKDASGNIEIDEFIQVLEKFSIADKLTKSQIGQLMSQFDIEGKGTINYNEFCDTIFANTNRPKPTEAPKFEGGSAYIDQIMKAQSVSKEAREIKAVAEEFSQKFLEKKSHVRKTFRKFDVNKDGTVSKDEFFLALEILSPEFAMKKKVLLAQAFFGTDKTSISYNDFMVAMFGIGTPRDQNIPADDE